MLLEFSVREQSLDRQVAAGSARLDLLDSVRGFAVMGLFMVHSVEQYELFYLHGDYGAVLQWVFGLFSNKAYALMALCFGVSFYLIMQGAARRGHDYSWRFAWRLTLLLGMGLLHGFIYRGDILQILALLGFAMLLFDKVRSNRILLLLAALCFVQIPLLLRAWAASKGLVWGLAQPLFYRDDHLSALASANFSQALWIAGTYGFVMKWSYFIEAGRITQLLGLFMVGLVLARIGFFADPDRFKLQRRVSLCVSVLFSAFLYFWAGSALDSALADGPVRQNLHFALENWVGLAVASSELLLFMELFQSTARPLARAFAAPGRMTLTLYVGQSLVFVPIYYGFGLGLYDKLTPWQCLEIGIFSFAIQMALAHWWVRRFHYGPLEWLWRAATRTSLDVPFIKAPVLAAI